MMHNQQSVITIGQLIEILKTKDPAGEVWLETDDNMHSNECHAVIDLDEKDILLSKDR